VKIPRDDPIELLLPILTALNGSPSHVRRHVSVQPLLAEHCEERGEERSREAGIQDGLDLDSCVWGTGPSWWESGNIIAESGAVYLVDQDAEEGGRLFVWVWPDLGVDLDDEGGGHRGEQTGLLSDRYVSFEQSAAERLTKINVVFKSSSYLLLNSLSYSSATFL